MATSVMGNPAQTGKKNKYKEIKQTKVSTIFNVSADAIWQIVGPGFSNASTWSRAVDRATTSGEPDFEGAPCSNRSCELNASGFDKISETIIEYNPEERRLGYSVDSGLPGFVIYMANNWHIREVGANQSQVEMTVTIHLKPFMGTLMGNLFRKNVNKVLDEAIEDLRIYAETGEVSEAKRKRVAELQEKK